MNRKYKSQMRPVFSFTPMVAAGRAVGDSAWRKGGGKTGSEQGFTLFELLVAVLLLAMICSMIYSALNVSIRFSDKADRKLLTLTREYGIHGLINRQVRNAWFDPRRTKVIISASNDQLRLVTRSSLLYPRAGLVLAYYRYEPVEDKIYYVEKRDYYNLDYDEDYRPPREDMFLLMEDSGGMDFSYSPRENKVELIHRDKHYEFVPGCPQ